MTFPRRKQLIERCTDSSGPPIYRTLYGLKNELALSIESEKDWNVLPFVTKDVLLATPYRERVFARRKDIDHLRASSGTSGKPPLFSPRTSLRGMEYRAEYHDFKRAILAYGVPAAPHWHEDFQRSLGAKPSVIVFDPKNPAASVRLARIAGVDSISTFTFHMTIIGEHMVRERMNADIRLIEICGEACTHSLLDYLRATFPNATIIPFYGSSEVEDSPIGMPCRAIIGEEPLALYHAKEGRYHELIDPESGSLLPIERGVEGELVITAYPGEPSAFPMIRYRTGDMIRVIDTNCGRHHRWSFTVIGRAAMDFLKIAGGVLRADEAERVVRLFSDRISPRFEVHRFEHATPEGPKPQVEFRIEPLMPLDLDALAREIAVNLRVNSNRTYAQGVADGLYLPPACAVLEADNAARKSRRLIAH